MDPAIPSKWRVFRLIGEKTSMEEVEEDAENFKLHLKDSGFIFKTDFMLSEESDVYYAIIIVDPQNPPDFRNPHEYLTFLTNEYNFQVNAI